MSIIDEIRSARIESVPEEYRDAILASVKAQLVDGWRGDYALIDGAAHYPRQEWEIPKDPGGGGTVRAPFRFHEAIAEWLRTLGFSCCRHYNRGGVDNGMEVRIR